MKSFILRTQGYKRKRINSLLSLFLFLGSFVSAQELNCQITVSSQQVQGTDAKRIFDNLQKQCFEFVNNTRWTKDNFNTNERIECSMFINITERLSNDDYKATIQVQSRRPVFKASYNSPIFNYNDQNFVFKYIEQQPFDFNVNGWTNNLTSVLAYYAYVILALDYDSFSNQGGNEYWQKAQQIVNNAQGASDAGSGWKAFDGNKNRYWLIENITNPMFNPIRDLYFKYHRKGLDIMVDKTEEGRAAILESINGLRDLHKNRPGSFNMQVLFNAKCDEIVNIFSQATPQEKQTVSETLNLIDPANQNKYNKITGAN